MNRYENSEDEVDVGPVRKPPKRVKKEAERSKKVAVEHNQASPVDSDDENNKSKHKRSKRVGFFFLLVCFYT